MDIFSFGNMWQESRCFQPFLCLFIRRNEFTTIMACQKTDIPSSKEVQKSKQLEDTYTLDERFPVIYDELRRLASALSRSNPVTTLNPTALVNEAYLKLAGSKEFSSTSALHFKRLAAQVMRQVLCDAARRRLAVKRGEGASRVPLSDRLEQKDWSVEHILLIEDLIEKLRAQSPRQALIVECRFYGGLSDEEIAKELEISKPTVERDWRAARAWLTSHFNEQP
jgi:RNA polymerase sigma factor (TIGR02999 family)